MDEHTVYNIRNNTRVLVWATECQVDVYIGEDPLRISVVFRKKGIFALSLSIPTMGAVWISVTSRYYQGNI